VNVRTPPRRWDIVAFGLVVGLATLLRVVWLGSPDRTVFDESYYAQDACTYLRLGAEVCGGTREASWVHPPLGKWLIALGIGLGGYEPTAWRMPAVVAGVIGVAALFVLARRLTGSLVAAVVAAGVLAMDPLSIISSRVAMLDIFVTTAGVLAVLFAVLHRARIDTGPAPHGLFPPWLAAAGFACGVAAATKWSGVLIIAIVIVLVVAWEIDARRESGSPRQTAPATVAQLLVCLVFVPAIVYAASYAGVLEGRLWALPWEQDAWPRVFAGRQLHMATFHVGLDALHPYASPAWSWPLGKRAVVYFFEIDPAGRFRDILAFANLPIWLPGAIAAVVACGWTITRRRLRTAPFVIAVAVAGSYLPWLLLTLGRPFVFLHYVVPTIPFVALALGWGIGRLAGRAKAAAAGGIMAVALAVVVYWGPVIYGLPLTYDQWRMRMLFTDCGAGQIVDGRLQPIARPGPPPPGWCWV
jgi:dolichyl-phosphate-mannose--protein O-mannosyl transferase